MESLHRLWRWGAVVAALLISAFGYSLFASDPYQTQFFSAFIAYIAMMVIALYLALLASSQPSHSSI